MRYYIYLDKSVLRTLFSVINDTNFDIEVVEYSVKKSYSKSNGISIKPGIEKMCSADNDMSIKKEGEDENIGRRRNSDVNRQSVGVGYDHNNSCNIQTERKYINIEDITDMKNKGFYHKLIENIANNTTRENKRICKEAGYIQTYNGRIENENNGLFKINNTFVWYDKQKLEGDMDLYGSFYCKINVIGYKVNCMESDQNIVRAIAMYIE